jgi:hypothetical protein
MTEEAVINWDRVMHKNVRASDRTDVGSIIQIAGESRVMQGTNRQYEIPKSHGEGFDGSEVYLDIPYSEVTRYKMA